jgi:hypothetical protein
MKTRILVRCLILAATIASLACAVEPSREILSSDRVDRLSAQSDVVALVKVEAIDFIGKPIKSEGGQVVADIFSYGRLVSLRPIEVYSARTAVPTDSFYVFQKGAVQGLDQSRLEVGREYVVFLKVCSPPDLVVNSVETSPALPPDSYYSVLQERKGVIAKADTNAFLKVDESLRAKTRPAARPASTPAE